MMQENSLNIQWYPGHMTKTRRQMEEDLRLVDAVCEILDARIPVSSRNPDIDTLCGKKPRMVVLNRIDMADPAMTRRWADYFKNRGMAVIQTDCKTRRGISSFAPAVRALLADKLARYAVAQAVEHTVGHVIEYLLRRFCAGLEHEFRKLRLLIRDRSHVRTLQIRKMRRAERLQGRHHVRFASAVDRHDAERVALV